MQKIEGSEPFLKALPQLVEASSLERDAKESLLAVTSMMRAGEQLDDKSVGLLVSALPSLLDAMSINKVTRDILLVLSSNWLDTPLDERVVDAPTAKIIEVAAALKPLFFSSPNKKWTTRKDLLQSACDLVRAADMDDMRTEVILLLMGFWVSFSNIHDVPIDLDHSSQQVRVCIFLLMGAFSMHNGLGNLVGWIFS